MIRQARRNRKSASLPQRPQSLTKISPAVIVFERENFVESNPRQPFIVSFGAGAPLAGLQSAGPDHSVCPPVE